MRDHFIPLGWSGACSWALACDRRTTAPLPSGLPASLHHSFYSLALTGGADECRVTCGEALPLRSAPPPSTPKCHRVATPVPDACTSLHSLASCRARYVGFDQQCVKTVKADATQAGPKVEKPRALQARESFDHLRVAQQPRPYAWPYVHVAFVDQELDPAAGLAGGV